MDTAQMIIASLFVNVVASLFVGVVVVAVIMAFVVPLFDSIRDRRKRKAYLTMPRYRIVKRLWPDGTSFFVCMYRKYTHCGEYYPLSESCDSVEEAVACIDRHKLSERRSTYEEIVGEL